MVKPQSTGFSYIKNFRKMKFISPDTIHRYIRELSHYLDIEFQEDIKKIEESDKCLIIWNPYGYLAYNKPAYINKYKLYKKYRKEKKPIYIVERGALPNTIFIDNTGFNIESKSYDEKIWNHPLSEEELKKVKNYILEFKEDQTSLEPQKSNRLPRSEFFSRLNIDPKKKIIFVPMQIHNDTVTILWCDWVKNTLNFLNIIKELAEKYKDWIFLVKNHPLEKDEKYLLRKETDNLKIVDNFHYKDCIEYSDLVITINSGIGLQAMIWNKPVIVVGKAFYQFKDINSKANSKEELIDLINHKYIYPDYNKVLRFIYYLRFKYYTICSMRKIGFNASEPVYFEKITYKNLSGERINIFPKLKNHKTISSNCRVVYLFNEYGWAFEFEARNYKKFSKLDVIPLKYDIKNPSIKEILEKNPRIVVFPSAWHYHKYRKHIAKLKQSNIKIVVQYNSEYELNYTCYNADLIVVSNNFLYEKLKSRYSNIKFIPHWVDSDFFIPRYKYNNFTLGWVGRYDTSVKRFPLLFRLGYPILIKANYKGFLNPNRGRKDMVDFYNRIDILLILSENEGTPMPLLEAMSCGKMVISTNVGIAPLVLDDKYIIKEKDEDLIVKEFQKKLNYLKKHPDIIIMEGKRNRKFIEENYDYKTNVERLDAIYRDLVNYSNTSQVISKTNLSSFEIISRLLENGINVCLLNETCYNAVIKKDWSRENTIYLGVDDINKAKKIIKSNNNVIFDKFPRKVKDWNLWGLNVKVPFPVIGYLRNKGFKV